MRLRVSESEREGTHADGQRGCRKDQHMSTTPRCLQACARVRAIIMGGEGYHDDWLEASIFSLILSLRYCS